MTESEIDDLARSVQSLRKAIRNNNPLLRDVASSRLYSALGFPFGIIIAGYCVIAHDAVSRYGSLAAAPPALKIAGIILLTAFLVIGGILKIVLTRTTVKAVDKSAGFISVVRVLFGGKTSALILSSFIAIAGSIGFSIYIGKPWYIVPVTSVMVSFVAVALDLLVDLIEYRVMGWYSLIAGIVGLFFIERAPFLWTAAIYGGLMIAFGIAGFLRPAASRASDPAQRKNQHR